MDALLKNAQRIFDVARSGRGGDRGGGDGNDEVDPQDFALLIRPDGVLHFVMESPFSLEAAAIHAGAQSAYRITRSREGVRVHGRSASQDCVLEQRRPHRDLLRDQPLYRITSPLLTSCEAAS
jgi:hypothetical protein